MEGSAAPPARAGTQHHQTIVRAQPQHSQSMATRASETAKFGTHACATDRGAARRPTGGHGAGMGRAWGREWRARRRPSHPGLVPRYPSQGPEVHVNGEIHLPGGTPGTRRQGTHPCGYGGGTWRGRGYTYGCGRCDRVHVRLGAWWQGTRTAGARGGRGRVHARMGQDRRGGRTWPGAWRGCTARWEAMPRSVSVGTPSWP